MAMKLSLVIPCYNEAPSLTQLAERCKDVIDTHPDVEIILVDNGSTDNTPDILKQLPVTSVRVDINRGYGHGILAGLQSAHGDILGWTHADMQTDVRDVIRAKTLFERHGDQIFVKGQRYGRPFGDVFFTIGMSLFETALLRKPLWDINAQPAMFPRSFYQSWQNPPHDFALDLYAYYQAKKQGLEIHRFPVKFGDRIHGTSHWNINWAAKMKFIQRTVRFSLQLRRDS